MIFSFPELLHIDEKVNIVIHFFVSESLLEAKCGGRTPAAKVVLVENTRLTQPNQDVLGGLVSQDKYLIS